MFETVASYVNLGCGSRFCEGWLNIDLRATHPAVKSWDLRQGIPLKDGACDLVYHSHLLEHLPQAEAMQFLRECCRVLRAGGVIRIAVPDLEVICRLYLQRLDATLAGDSQAAADCEWMRIELMDQMVREELGGRMKRELERPDLPNRAFVHARVGGVQPTLHENSGVSPGAARPARGRGRSWIWWRDCLRKGLVRLVLTAEQRRALIVGAFRTCGEVHRWMYDRVSLAALLVEAGFVAPRAQTATTSLVPNWAGFALDSDTQGCTVKPDSLFMEAQAPDERRSTG